MISLSYSKSLFKKIDTCLIEFLTDSWVYISEIIKYSKSLQKRFNLNINDYKEYIEIFSSIEIEI